VRVGQPVAALTVVLPAPRPNLHVTPATIVQLARATAHMRPTTVVTGPASRIAAMHPVAYSVLLCSPSATNSFLALIIVLFRPTMHATLLRECRRVVLWKTVSIVLRTSQDVKLMNRFKDPTSEDIKKFLTSSNTSVLVLRIANELLSN